VLSGDWLTCRPFAWRWKSGISASSNWLIGLTQQMVEGELLQMERSSASPSPKANTTTSSYRKTACLLKSPCVWVRTGWRGPPVGRRMGITARKLGLAFQIVLTNVSTSPRPKSAGKPVPANLREGKATLAVISPLDNGSTPAERLSIQTVRATALRPRLAGRNPAHSQSQPSRFNYAMKSAFGYSAAAQPRSQAVPDSEYKRALQWMPEFVVAREKIARSQPSPLLPTNNGFFAGLTAVPCIPMKLSQLARALGAEPAFCWRRRRVDGVL